MLKTTASSAFFVLFIVFLPGLTCFEEEINGKKNAVFVEKKIQRRKQKHQRGFIIITIRATQELYGLVLAMSLMKLDSFAVLATEL